VTAFAFEVLKAQWRYRLTLQYAIETGISSRGGGNRYVHLSPDGLLVLSDGYAWDGPSGPTLDTPDFMRASAVHDALYQLMGSGKLPIECREKVDQLFHEILIEDKMPRFRAWYVHWAVKLFGSIVLRWKLRA